MSGAEEIRDAARAYVDEHVALQRARAVIVGLQSELATERHRSAELEARLSMAQATIDGLRTDTTLLRRLAARWRKLCGK